MVASSSSIPLRGFLDTRRQIQPQVGRVIAEDRFDPSVFRVPGWKVVDHVPGVRLRLEELPRRNWIRLTAMTLIAVFVASFLWLAWIVRLERVAPRAQDPGGVFAKGSLVILGLVGTPLFVLGLIPARPRRTVIAIDCETRRITIPERSRTRWWYLLNGQVPDNVTVPLAKLTEVRIVRTAGLSLLWRRSVRASIRLSIQADVPYEARGPEMLTVFVDGAGRHPVEVLAPLARSISALSGVVVRGADGLYESP